MQSGSSAWNSQSSMNKVWMMEDISASVSTVSLHCRWHGANCEFPLRVCKTKKRDTVKYNFYSDGSEKFYSQGAVRRRSKKEMEDK